MAFPSAAPSAPVAPLFSSAPSKAKAGAKSLTKKLGASRVTSAPQPADGFGDFDFKDDDDEKRAARSLLQRARLLQDLDALLRWSGGAAAG